MPGMFSKNDEPVHTESTRSTHTLIGTTLHIEGTVKSEEDIVIAGTLNGSLHTTQNLTIEPSAHIEGDVHAQDILVSGEVKGNLTATGKTTLTQSARITGDITTSGIAIEHGAQLNGKLNTRAE